MTSFEFDALVESTRSSDPDLFEAPYCSSCAVGIHHGHTCSAFDPAIDPEHRDFEATVDAIDEYLQHRAAEPTWRRRALDPEAEGVALQWRHGTDLTGYLRAR
jgi:hypothetical protein